jgi:hypothetical protein
MRILSNLVIASLVMSVGSIPALAQFNPYYYYESLQHQNEINAYYNQQAWNQTNAAALRNGANQNAALVACRKAPGGCNGRFTPGAIHSGPGAIATLLGKSDVERQQIIAQATGFLGSYGRYSARLGLPRNDLASSSTLCLLTAVNVFRGEVPNISPAAAARVLTQAQRVISNNGSIASMGNAARQQQYEVLAINAAYLDSEFRTAQAAGDQQRVARVRQLAGAIIKDITGTAPEKVRLTATGISLDGVGSAAPRPGVAQNSVQHSSDPGGYVGGSTRFAFDPAAVITPRNGSRVAAFDQLVRSKGGDPRDVAWGAAVAFATYYQVDRELMLTNRQIIGTVTLARAHLLAQAEGATNRDKQQLYENIASQAMEFIEGLRDIESQRPLGDAHALNNRTRAARTHAHSSIEYLLQPYRLADFNMTPDGMVKVR